MDAELFFRDLNKESAHVQDELFDRMQLASPNRPLRACRLADRLRSLCRLLDGSHEKCLHMLRRAREGDVADLIVEAEMLRVAVAEELHMVGLVAAAAAEVAVVAAGAAAEVAEVAEQVAQRHRLPLANQTESASIPNQRGPIRSSAEVWVRDTRARLRAHTPDQAREMQGLLGSDNGMRHPSGLD